MAWGSLALARAGSAKVTHVTAFDHPGTVDGDLDVAELMRSLAED